MSSWRRSHFIAWTAVLLFLVIQLWVPASRLGDHDRAPRFGWQMFSTYRESPQFVVETPTQQREISLEDYVAGVRGEIDLEGLLPPHLCNVFPDAIEVTWESGEFTCPSG